MTQEEKARAYDEALEKAKIEINTKGIGETVNLCEQLFPELRESEDENLKNKSGYYKDGKFWKASTLWNATRNKVPQRVSNIYNILRECTWNIRTLQDFAKEVKNVQEVSLDYPIILDMNGNILDGAHRVVKAYLEGKDIDIVYLRDDEWPEPDYDEEKAVRENDDERIKKSLIKFLTDIKEISESGRTSWAVRKEDAEMCKSFLDYLGKQKVQNEITIEQVYKEFINPEKLKDAKINKYIRAQLLWELMHNGIITKVDYQYLTDTNRKPWTEEEYRKAYQKDFEASEQLKQKEQKSVPFSCSHENGESGEKQDYSELNDLERAILRGFLAAGIENVPIGIIKDTASECVRFLALTESKSEWSEEDKKMLNHLIDKIQENLNIRMPDGHSFGISNDEKETFSSWLRCLPERFNLQPNQEWSEEDEAAYNAFICEVVNEKMNPTAEQVKWLRSICDRLKFLYPQPKAEWSEEDESSLKELIHYFESLLDCLATEKGHAENRKWLKFLKSLRPQSKQEWNNEDKSMLNTIIAVIKSAQRDYALGTNEWIIRSKAIRWIESLPKRFNPPKQEWKEVELEFRGEKVKIKRPFFCDDKGHEYSTTELDEDVAWYALRAWCKKKGVLLYDLYPKDEWDEEDVKMYNMLRSIICGTFVIETHKTRDKLLFWLKSLRPPYHGDVTMTEAYKLGFEAGKASSWKPSKEQMDSLRDTIANTKGYSYSIYLPELYEQLEKLL